ncbi:uncharacterized [Tachysurus ichikawai]
MPRVVYGQKYVHPDRHISIVLREDVRPRLRQAASSEAKRTRRSTAAANSSRLHTSTMMNLLQLPMLRVSEAWRVTGCRLGPRPNEPPRSFHTIKNKAACSE